MPYAWFSEMIVDYTSFQKIQFGYVVFCLVFVLLIPCILIVYSQAVTFKAIAKRGRHCVIAKKEVRKARNEKKCLMIFAVMAIIYVVCWLPWFVLTLFFSFWLPLSIETRKILYDLSQAFVIFRYLTSIVNPLLYTFLKKDFLEAFKRLVLRRKRNISRTHSSVTEPGSGSGLQSLQRKLIRYESKESLDQAQCITAL